ncbi:MAG: cytochrome C [Herminiimonas sp.]|nr:cytochrome C [Herminiimonas sp.]
MRSDVFLMHVFFLALAIIAPARAADPAMVSGQRLTASCTSCHAIDSGSRDTVLPSLTTQSKDDLVAKMKAFKGGSRQATIMHQLAKGYSDEQIELIAGYLAAQKK